MNQRGLPGNRRATPLCRSRSRNLTSSRTAARREKKQMKRLIAVLALVVLGLGLTTASPATADETGTPSKKDGGISVGLRTATKTAGDERGRYEYEIPPKGVVVDYVA